MFANVIICGKENINILRSMIMGAKKIMFILISIITIIGGGYLLFNVGFILFALVVNATMEMSGQSENDTPRMLSHLLGYVTIGLFTYILKSYLGCIG